MLTRHCDCFIIYKYNESLCCVLETNKMLYVNYSSINPAKNNAYIAVLLWRLYEIMLIKTPSVVSGKGLVHVPLPLLLGIQLTSVTKWPPMRFSQCSVAWRPLFVPFNSYSFLCLVCFRFTTSIQLSLNSISIT